MTPNAQAAPPAAPPRSSTSEQPIPRRLSFRRSLRESGLPEDYLEALDAKRRQLDDSIWKYIASKEREYKNYQKELRHQRRASQGQDGEAVGANGNGNGGKKRRSVGERKADDGSVDGLPEKAVKVDGVGGKISRSDEGSETMDRGSIAGLKDRRASFERDKDFVGVFTPTFLPALSDEAQGAPAILERTSSTPEQLVTSPTLQLAPTSLARANSDSTVHGKKPTRPSQLVLQHRTSSSGSSADGKLPSAMKSPTQQPKRKRVSLAVGDAIVAPSDNVPSSLLSSHSTPSHSRIRQVVAPLPERTEPSTQSSRNSASGTAGQTTSVVAQIMQAEQTAVAIAKIDNSGQSTVLSPELVAKNDFAAVPIAIPSRSSNIDPDGDLFDLESEEHSELPPPMVDSDDDDEDAIEDDDEDDDDDDDDEVSGRVDSASTSATSNPIFTPPPGERYDPEAGMIPEPEGEPDSAVPYLPSSAQTSQMPSKPGFRRPSVVHDPVFRNAGYAEAERQAVEDETYGSSYAWPPTKGSFTSGSLGESFMEKNAEQMMKLREERQRVAQVRS